MPAISLKCVSKGYRRLAHRFPAIQGFSLLVESGECVGLVGPNGCGKTTLILLLLGFLRPNSGRLSVLGREPGHPVSLGRIGWCPDRPIYPLSWSPREVLLDSVRLQHSGPAQPYHVCDASLTFFGLEHIAHKPCRELSQGLRQRVSLALAFVRRPELLLLDEPFRALDEQGTELLVSLLRRSDRPPRTAIIASHRTDLLREFCTRIVGMENGRLEHDSAV